MHMEISARHRLTHFRTCSQSVSSTPKLVTHFDVSSPPGNIVSVISKSFAENVGAMEVAKGFYVIIRAQI